MHIDKVLIAASEAQVILTGTEATHMKPAL